MPDQSSLLVYPNPTDGQFTVALDNVSGHLMVMNMLGEMIRQKTVYEWESEVIIDFSDQSPGIYVITIHSSFGIYRYKVVIR